MATAWAILSPSTPTAVNGPLPAGKEEQKSGSERERSPTCFPRPRLLELSTLPLSH